MNCTASCNKHFIKKPLRSVTFTAIQKKQERLRTCLVAYVWSVCLTTTCANNYSHDFSPKTQNYIDPDYIHNECNSLSQHG